MPVEILLMNNSDIYGRFDCTIQRLVDASQSLSQVLDTARFVLKINWNKCNYLRTKKF